jgi:GTP cyclohydrolase I
MSASVRKLRRGSRGNECLLEPLDASERAGMVAAATTKLEELFDTLAIDYRNDHNTRDTPARVARMLVEELLAGRYTPPPLITDFDNVHGYGDLIVAGPIDVRSTCAHHLMPIYGQAFVGIVPSEDGRLLGLSKYDRIVAHFAARLQIQEELVVQIARHIEEVAQPAGVAVRISAVHMCKTQRGVRASHNSRMVSMASYGALLTDNDLKQRFLQECIALERLAER